MYTGMQLGDELTGLPNRLRLLEELGSHVARARRSGWQGALLALDLDDFKAINDSMGAAAGDWLIQRTVEKLQGRLRSSDFVARIGEDEFAVLMHNADVTSARILADTLVTAIASEDSDQVPCTTASVGIALCDGPTTGDELMTRAFVALSTAKERGGSSFVLYSPTLDRRSETESGDVAASARPG
jgi:diguanylate cyclase (GGDEF)-like protein